MAINDFRTFTNEIAARMAKDSDTDLEHIKRSVCRAIQHYRDTRFDFNEAQATFSTAADTATYSAGSGANNYPSDLMFIDKAQITVSNGTYTLEPRTLSEIRECRWNSSTTSKPTEYAWSRRVIDLYPTPDGTYTVTLDYVQDVGTPQMEYDGSSWIFYDEDGSVITNAYTSDWFDEAGELISSRVEWDLWTYVYKDYNAGMAAKGREREALAELRSKRTRDQHAINRVGMI